MESVTLAQLKTMVREAADMVNSQFISDSELQRYIDMSYAELYDLLVSTYEDYYTKDPVVFQVTSGNTYSLPADFYKLVALDIGNGGSSSSWSTLRPFMIAERNKRSSLNRINFIGMLNIAYKLMGQKIVFFPEDQAVGTYRMWYIPKRTPLLVDADVMDGVNGFHQYVVVDAAIKCLRKEESDTSHLDIEKEALIKRIEAMAPNRDAANTFRIQDIYAGTMDFGLPQMW